MDWKLEVVTIPVADLDSAKQFYADKLGFNVDVDNAVGDSWRNIQLTPAGSACSVAIGEGFGHGLQLVVSDAVAAHAELVSRGVDVGEIVHFEGSEQLPGRGGPWNTFFFFQDPDGNNWAVQEKPM
jgi:catechol 2,3-dioxygenase-like lactoylglutathione lyase family enzyme